MITTTLGRRGVLSLAAGLVAGCVCTLAGAQDSAPRSAPNPNLPAAADILAKAEKAMGGREAFEKIKSSQMSATMNNPMAGEMKMETFFAEQGKFLIKQTIPAMGMSFSFGSDGKVGWMNNPMQGGYSLLDEEMLKQVREDTGIHQMVWNVKKQFPTMETVAQTAFKGKDAFKVKLVNEQQEEWFGFFDTKNNLPLGFEAQQETPMGPTMTTIQFDEWKELEGVKTFTKMLIGQPMGDMTLAFDKIEYNKVDDAIFELPEEVKKLAEAPASQPTSQPAGVGVGG